MYIYLMYTCMYCYVYNKQQFIIFTVNEYLSITSN